MTSHLSKILQKKDIRILVTRTDRIGDVLLSTPVFSAIRERYPSAHIAALALPYTADLLQGHPAIDEVIVYDKRRTHKYWWQHAGFISDIRRKKFDCVLHLHPTNRMHWISFASRIPVRIGYDRKASYLLTHEVKHFKQEGERHEAEYNFDLLALLDIPKPDCLVPRISLVDADREALDYVLAQDNVVLPNNFFIINPGASCPSKMWPAGRFAALTDQIATRYNLTPVIVGDNPTKYVTDYLKEHLTTPFIDFSEERLTLRELGVLFARARFLISNDTGLVHLASAVDLPLISIFGRSDKGLGPKRWGPLGDKSMFIHKPEGCAPCKAHNCTISFKCLHNIEIEDVLRLLDGNREKFHI